LLNSYDYDTYGRLDEQRVSAGGVAFSAGQLSYDAAGRVRCQAARLDVLSYSPNACQVETSGSFGPSRIAENTYDSANRVIKVRTAYGVAGQARDSVTTTYTDNGFVKTVKDAKNNETEYIYDGHGRLIETRYPDPISGAPSSSDTEKLTYDIGGQVIQRELRDGQIISYTYNDRYRLTFVDAPGSSPDTAYAYDVIGRLTGADLAASGRDNSFTYDILGRQLTASSVQGEVSYQYDLAGRRTRMTWPDNFYVDYVHDGTGAVTGIREYGAASGAGLLATYDYNGLGQRTKITRRRHQLRL